MTSPERLHWVEKKLKANSGPWPETQRAWRGSADATPLCFSQQQPQPLVMINYFLLARQYIQELDGCQGKLRSNGRSIEIN